MNPLTFDTNRGASWLKESSSTATFDHPQASVGSMLELPIPLSRPITPGGLLAPNPNIDNNRRLWEILDAADGVADGCFFGQEIPDELKYEEITTIEFNNLVRFFKMFDKDGSGGIGPGELSEILTSMQLPMSKQKAASVIADVDCDNDGQLEFNEFVRLMTLNRHLICADTGEAVDPSEKLKLKGVWRTDETWLRYWDTLVLWTTFYFCVMSVFRSPNVLARVVVELILTCVLLADVWVSSRLAFIREDNSLEVNPGAIRRRYLNSWFLVDVVGLLPLDIVMEYVGFAGAGWFALVRYLRLLRVHRLFKGSNTDYYVTASYIRFNYHFAPLMVLVFWAFLAIHGIAMIGVQLKIGMSNYPKGAASTRQLYGIALYFTLYTLSTCGYGDVFVETEAQRAFCCCIFICAMCANGIVLAKITAYLSDKSIENQNQHKMREALALLHHFKVPVHIRNDVLAYRNHILRTGLNASYEAALTSLPEQVQDDVGIFIRLSFLSRVPLFRAATLDCKAQLSARLKRKYFGPGEFIILFGEEGSEMFFINHGLIEVLTRSGQLLTTLKPGDFFGEAALLDEGVRRTASIRAATHAEMWVIDKKDFHEILDRFPIFRNTVEREAERREAQPKAAPKPGEAVTLFHTGKRTFNVYAEDLSLPSSATDIVPVSSGTTVQERREAVISPVESVPSFGEEPSPRHIQLFGNRSNRSLSGTSKKSMRPRSPKSLTPTAAASAAAQPFMKGEMERKESLGTISRAKNALRRLSSLSPTSRQGSREEMENLKAVMKQLTHSQKAQADKLDRIERLLTQAQQATQVAPKVAPGPPAIPVDRELESRQGSIEEYFTDDASVPGYTNPDQTNPRKVSIIKKDLSFHPTASMSHILFADN